MGKLRISNKIVSSARCLRNASVLIALFLCGLLTAGDGDGILTYSRAAIGERARLSIKRDKFLVSASRTETSFVFSPRGDGLVGQ